MNPFLKKFCSLPSAGYARHVIWRLQMPSYHEVSNEVSKLCMCLQTSPEENGQQVSKGAQRNTGFIFGVCGRKSWVRRRSAQALIQKRIRPKIHPKWILITVLSRWGWKNASTLLRRQFFHGIYSVFCTSHIPKAACNIAPKIQKLSSHAGKTRFFTRTHPRKHAQEAFCSVIYNVFLHISNTDFDPQKSANHHREREREKKKRWRDMIVR